MLLKMQSNVASGKLYLNLKGDAYEFLSRIINKENLVSFVKCYDRAVNILKDSILISKEQTSLHLGFVDSYKTDEEVGQKYRYN